MAWAWSRHRCALAGNTNVSRQPAGVFLHLLTSRQRDIACIYTTSAVRYKAGAGAKMASPSPSQLNSTLQRSLREEFERLCSRDRDHLVLQELLKLRFSQVPVANLAVLWVLDRWVMAVA